MKKPTRYYSKRQEQQVAKSLEGRCHANSGATPFRKGDVNCGIFLIECKTSTEKRRTYSVKQDDLDKMNKERFSMGKEYAALCFDFGPETERYYVITEKLMKDFKRLLEEEKERFDEQ